MELPILSITKIEKGKKQLPKQFNESVRPDLIKKVVLAIQSNKRQPYGAAPKAGMRHSAELSRRRRKYRGSYGAGISRVPRKILSRSGTRFNWVGAFAPGTVGGRRAHPPKADKNWNRTINIKENRKAIRSALSATIKKDFAEERGHILPENYPFIVEESLQNIKTTKQAEKTLKDLGLEKELSRISKTSIRAGKGKMRGRKHKKIRGILIVVSGRCEAQKSFKNIPGVEIAVVDKLNAELLAPGTIPGRLTLFTEQAIESLEKNKFFM